MDIRRGYQKARSILGLSFQLAKAEFKLRNEDSYIGIFWYLLNPILMFLLLFLIFSDRLGNNIPYYSLYLLLGLVMFNFFQSTTTQSIKSIIENNGIIKSINFPRESLVFGTLFSNIFSHFFEIILFFLAALLFSISLIGIFYYFIIFFFFCFFVMGISLILSSLEVYFRDLDNIWMFVSRMIMLGTPIFYAISGQIRLFYINLFNPIYFFITAARDLIIYNRLPELWLILGLIGYSILYFIMGVLVFNRLKIKFAEML